MASIEELNATMLHTMPNGTPLTGVINVNDVDSFLIDEIFSDGVDLDFEGYIEENGDDQEMIDMYEMDSPTILLGFIKDDDGKYDIDENAEYSIKYNGEHNTIQVVHSKYIKMALNACSPCYPGQADLETNEGLLFAWSLKKEDVNECASDAAKMGIFEFIKTEEITRTE